jgi:hypothetical protein
MSKDLPLYVLFLYEKIFFYFSGVEGSVYYTYEDVHYEDGLSLLDSDDRDIFEVRDTVKKGLRLSRPPSRVVTNQTLPGRE